MVHAVRRKYSILNNIVQICSNEQERMIRKHFKCIATLSCVREKYSGLSRSHPAVPLDADAVWLGDARCPRPAQYPSLFVATLGCKCRPAVGDQQPVHASTNHFPTVNTAVSSVQLSSSQDCSPPSSIFLLSPALLLLSA